MNTKVERRFGKLGRVVTIFSKYGEDGDLDPDAFEQDLNDAFAPLGGPAVAVLAIEAVEKAKMEGRGQDDIRRAARKAIGGEFDEPTMSVAVEFATEAYSGSQVWKKIIDDRRASQERNINTGV